MASHYVFNISYNKKVSKTIKQKSVEEKLRHMEAKFQDAPTPAASTANETDEFQDSVKNFSAIQFCEILKTLALKVFTKKELAEKPISGKKCAKSGDNPRQPLDPERMALLEKLFLEKCPDMNHKVFMEKLQNIQKVVTRENQTERKFLHCVLYKFCTVLGLKI